MEGNRTFGTTLRLVGQAPAANRSPIVETLRWFNPPALARSLWRHRRLIAQFTRRNVASRYRGSYLGFAWSFLIPLLMLLVFTLVFGVIFQSRWGSTGGTQLEFALFLFCGLVVFNVFAECTTKAPNLILGNPNLVKRVVFPLEILPVVLVASAAFHGAISFLILLLGAGFAFGTIHWTVVLAPIVFLPLGLLCLGIGWFLAALGVFLRDIAQIIGVLTTAVLFLSPIFYPVSAIPPRLAPLYLFNPLTFIIKDMRAVVLLGELPGWTHLGAGVVLTLLIAQAGYAWFQRSRGGFADVL